MGDDPQMSPRFIEWVMGLPDGWVTGTGISETAQVRALGNAVVLNPARQPGGLSWEEYMRLGIANVLQSTDIALLPGWEGSRGATLEAHIARELGLGPWAWVAEGSGGTMWMRRIREVRWGELL